MRSTSFRSNPSDLPSYGSSTGQRRFARSYRPAHSNTGPRAHWTDHRSDVLRRQSTLAKGLDPLPLRTIIPTFFPCAGREHEYYLTYFGAHRPARMRLDVPEGEEYTAEIVDTWGTTVTPVSEPILRGGWVELPERPYHALILRRTDLD